MTTKRKGRVITASAVGVLLLILGSAALYKYLSATDPQQQLIDLEGQITAAEQAVPTKATIEAARKEANAACTPRNDRCEIPAVEAINDLATAKAAEARKKAEEAYHLLPAGKGVDAAETAAENFHLNGDVSVAAARTKLEEAKKGFSELSPAEQQKRVDALKKVADALTAEAERVGGIVNPILTRLASSTEAAKEAARLAEDAAREDATAKKLVATAKPVCSEAAADDCTPCTADAQCASGSTCDIGGGGICRAAAPEAECTTNADCAPRGTGWTCDQGRCWEPAPDTTPTEPKPGPITPAPITPTPITPPGPKVLAGAPTYTVQDGKIVSDIRPSYAVQDGKIIVQLKN